MKYGIGKGPAGFSRSDYPTRVNVTRCAFGIIAEVDELNDQLGSIECAIDNLKTQLSTLEGREESLRDAFRAKTGAGCDCVAVGLVIPCADRFAAQLTCEHGTAFAFDDDVLDDVDDAPRVNNVRDYVPQR